MMLNDVNFAAAAPRPWRLWAMTAVLLAAAGCAGLQARLWADETALLETSVTEAAHLQAQARRAALSAAIHDEAAKAARATGLDLQVPLAALESAHAEGVRVRSIVFKLADSLVQVQVDLRDAGQFAAWQRRLDEQTPGTPWTLVSLKSSLTEGSQSPGPAAVAAAPAKLPALGLAPPPPGLPPLTIAALGLAAPAKTDKSDGLATASLRWQAR